MEYTLKSGNKTITLTNEEAKEVYYAVEREYIRNDIETLLFQHPSLELDENSIDCCIDEFLRIRDKCDPYFDAYWGCIEQATENISKK